MKDKGQEFFEAMPGTMDQTMMGGGENRSWIRSILPWIIVPAIAFAMRMILTSLMSGRSDSQNKPKYMPKPGGQGIGEGGNIPRM